MKIENPIGSYLGLCNRTACRAPKANWYNHSTRKYYCFDCAIMLNRENFIDAMRLFGHDLCTEVKTPQGTAK